MLENALELTELIAVSEFGRLAAEYCRCSHVSAKVVQGH
jgi:hypothetical protein